MNLSIRTGILLLTTFGAVAFAQDAKNPTVTAPAAATTAVTAPPVTPDKAQAYYHFQLAHMYEEMVAQTGLSEYAAKAVDEYKLAIQYDPTSEYLNASLAELYAKTGRVRDAVLEGQEILKRDPKNLDARRLLGRIYLRWLGDTQSGTQSQEMLHKAIEQYEEIVKIAPSGVEDHLLLGRLYRLDNTDPQSVAKAREQFKAAVALQPNSEEALSTLSYLYNEQGDSAGALALLEAVPEAERNIKINMALGYTYEQRKEYKKAVEAFQKAADDDKDNLDAVRQLAQNLLNDGQVEAALRQYKLVAEADPQDAQTFMRMAEIYRRDGKFDQALESLRRAQALVTDSVEIPYNLAVIYQAQGKFDEAAAILKDLLQKTAKDDNLYTPGERNNRALFAERLGGVYRDQNKPQQAVDAFRLMIPLGDDNVPRAYTEMIDTYREARMWQKALEVGREAVAKLPADREMQLALAEQEADLGQPDAAVARVKV